MANFWRNKPILSWVVDDFEQFNSILGTSFNLADYIKRYNENSFSNKIAKLIFSTPFSLNLGGETKKNRLVATDKPIGVFNFSLASKTLFPLSEFFSQKLKDEDPNRFSSLNLLSGIVPNILVEFIVIGGENKYYYKDERGVEYPCEKRVKGQTAIDNGVPNAKLEYKSKTKKVYQTYKRKGGKVRYVEIYTLFYYERVEGDLQFAIRHLPAMMVAEYLESIGIKVRIYMTRFVELQNRDFTLREFDIDTNVKLPMYLQPIVAKENNYFKNALLVQPIIAKEFQQEIHNPLAYLISSNAYDRVYRKIAENTIQNETTSGWTSVFGEPRFSQDEYMEGFERYRNKYLKYVKDGLFKSKEILPESMIFFHDISINFRLNSFCRKAVNYGNRSTGNYLSEEDALLLPEVNVFFNWWMKLSANMIKHKVNIINSNELNKDLREIKSDLEASFLENKRIISTTQEALFQSDLIDLTKKIYNDLAIKTIKLPNGSEIVNFNSYIQQLTNELNVFADDDFFPTPEDEVIRRLEFSQTILDELKKI